MLVIQKNYDIELKQIICYFEKYKTLNWILYEIEMTGSFKDGTLVTDFENLVNNSNNGLVLSWVELLSLSESIYEVINIKLGAYDCKISPDLKLDIGDINSWACRICLIDSTYWEIDSIDETILESIQKGLNC